MNEELIPVQSLIYEIRGKKVMLDCDLAKLYGIETRALKQAVRRNLSRFPDDFMFELSIEETKGLPSRSQFVTLEGKQSRGSNTKYKPFVFTEQGVAMLSSVLKSDIDSLYEAIAALSARPQLPEKRNKIGFKRNDEE